MFGSKILRCELLLLSCLFYFTTSLALPSKVLQAHLTSPWYQTDPQLLSQQCKALDDIAQSHYKAELDPSQIRVIIVPHAGYAYSGKIAAAVYRLIASKSISRIIILAPSHYRLYEGVALPESSSYVMPTGSVYFPEHIIKKLAKKKYFKFDDSVFDGEHSFEIQLPLLFYYLGKKSKVLPLLVGDIDVKEARLIAQDLVPFIDNKTLVIVSTDFTHYGKRFNYTPFVNSVSERIHQLDAQVFAPVQAQDLLSYMQVMAKTGATVCGKTPLMIFLALCEQHAFGPHLEPRLIAYDTSGYTNDSDGSVSYAGLAFSTQKREDQLIEDQFTQQEQRDFLHLSRKTLGSLYQPSVEKLWLPLLSSAAAHEKRGVFVTLYKDGNLAGCIGTIEPQHSLQEGIISMTKAAALHDSRFEPIREDELPKITLSVSILSSTRPVPSYKDIKLSKHGIILENGLQSALFLPEVPHEFGWDLPTTLTQLSKKAGLSDTAWQEPSTKFKVFTSLDIKEATI